MNSNNYVGTRWHKCDLHLHTPASLCFRDRKTVTAEQWVAEAINKGLSCVAVTDHNTGEWIDQIKVAAEETSLTVFPGVEITCSDAKVHLLVIFDIEKGTSDIEDFLLKANIERKMYGLQTAHSSLSCADVTALATVRGAIVIPAHIDEFNGICEMGNQPRKDFLAMKQIKSVQVVHKQFTLSDKQYQNEIKDGLKEKLNSCYGVSAEDLEKGKLKIDASRMKDWRQATKQSMEHRKAILTFSDNPHEPNDSQHGLWGIGSRFTWIKMDAQPSLECLRQALLVPEERILNDFNISEGEIPYKTPGLWIEKITFLNTEITEFEKLIEVDFSPQMTSIVGGRGSGKSTVLSFIRGLFPVYREALSDVPNIKSEFDSFFRKPQGSPLKGVLNPVAEIEILLRRRNNLYKIEYKVNEGDVSKIFRLNPSDESWIEETDDGFINLLELDIYSQKQVFEIANRPNALRNKIDRDIPSVAGIKQDLKELESAFLTHCAHIRELQVKIDEKKVLETEINDIETRLSVLDVSAFSELLNKQQNFSLDESEIESFKSDVEIQLSNLKDAIDAFQFPNQLPTISSNEGKYEPEVTGLISSLKNEFESIQSELLKYHKQGLESLEAFSVRLEDSQWEKGKQQMEGDYIRKQEQLTADGVQEISSTEEIEREMNSVKGKRQQIHEIEKLEVLLAEAFPENEKKKAAFFKKREELTKVRLAFLNGLLEGNVRAKIRRCGDLDHWENSFRQIINSYGSYKTELIALKERWQLGRAPIENNGSFMKIFLDIISGDYRGGDFSGHFTKRIRGLGESQIDKLRLLVPEDRISVEYKANEKSNFKPIATASPGQKTAAILTFLLSHGDQPLIIDQPEDDLDTSLIHSLVVNQLRNSKSRRQVIIVTHNPNIPVNGDSEHIVVMNSDSKYVEPKHSGSIDDMEIRRLICDVMEGGVEAFNLRSQRYKLS